MTAENVAEHNSQSFVSIGAPNEKEQMRDDSLSRHKKHASAHAQQALQQQQQQLPSRAGERAGGSDDSKEMNTDSDDNMSEHEAYIEVDKALQEGARQGTSSDDHNSAEASPTTTIC